MTPEERAALPWADPYSDYGTVPDEDLERFIATATEFGHKITMLQDHRGLINAGCAYCCERMQWDTIDCLCRAGIGV